MNEKSKLFFFKWMQQNKFQKDLTLAGTASKELQLMIPQTCA